MALAQPIEAWVSKVKTAWELIRKESIIEMVRQMQAIVPVDTGFLRASLVASTNRLPLAVLENPHPSGALVYPLDTADVELVIHNAASDDTIFLGYTAQYAAYVHYGAQGRPARPWVDMIAQRWPVIVAQKTAEVRMRLGLSL